MNFLFFKSVFGNCGLCVFGCIFFSYVFIFFINVRYFIFKIAFVFRCYLSTISISSVPKFHTVNTSFHSRIFVHTVSVKSFFFVFTLLSVHELPSSLTDL